VEYSYSLLRPKPPFVGVTGEFLPSPSLPILAVEALAPNIALVFLLNPRVLGPARVYTETLVSVPVAVQVIPLFVESELSDGRVICARRDLIGFTIEKATVFLGGSLSPNLGGSTCIADFFLIRPVLLNAAGEGRTLANNAAVGVDM
jgi:hypothetical protein